MAFVGSKNLKLLITQKSAISPFDPAKLKNSCYELSLGREVFQTDSSPRAVKKLTDKEKVYIEPGQFALLLTEETIKVPTDKIGFISIKAGIKFEGLVNVSGFHVDPGFEGKLLFSVYNAGPKRIVLSQGTSYFPIWFADINDADNYNGVHDNQNSIPDKPVEALSQGEIASPSSLSKRIDNNEESINHRLGLLEKERTAKDYLVKMTLGLAFVIVFKFCFDWLSYDNGLKKGLELKQKERTLDSIINLQLSEKKHILKEIDSLKAIKSNLIQRQNEK